MQNPLAPTPYEVMLLVNDLAALLCAGYAVSQVWTRRWTFGMGVVVVALLMVPVAGPLLAIGLCLLEGRRRRSAAAG